MESMTRLRTATIVTGLLVAPLFCGAAFAQAGDAAAPVYACRAIEDDTARLACYDRAVADLFARQEAGEVQTIDTAAIEQLERESFGFAMPSLPSLFSRRGSDETARPEISDQSAPIRSARVDPGTGKLVVTLENGQVWEQIDTARVSTTVLRRATEARIRRAALGSYLMNLGSGPAIRVRRIA